MVTGGATGAEALEILTTHRATQVAAAVTVPSAGLGDRVGETGPPLALASLGGAALQLPRRTQLSLGRALLDADLVDRAHANTRLSLSW